MTPGPGSYQENSAVKKNGWGFSKEQRGKGHDEKVPGPGQYELKPFFADVPKYLLPNKA
jgi:hypothetical protein